MYSRCRAEHPEHLEEYRAPVHSTYVGKEEAIGPFVPSWQPRTRQLGKRTCQNSLAVSMMMIPDVAQPALMASSLAVDACRGNRPAERMERALAKL